MLLMEETHRIHVLGCLRVCMLLHGCELLLDYLFGWFRIVLTLRDIEQFKVDWLGQFEVMHERLHE